VNFKCHYSAKPSFALFSDLLKFHADDIPKFRFEPKLCQGSFTAVVQIVIQLSSLAFLHISLTVLLGKHE